MAATEVAGDSATETTTVLRSYTVVRADGTSLDVLTSVMARNQEDACNRYRNTLSGEAADGTFGAFLTNSYKEWTFATVSKPVTTKKASAPKWQKDAYIPDDNEAAE